MIKFIIWETMETVGTVSDYVSPSYPDDLFVPMSGEVFAFNGKSYEVTGGWGFRSSWTCTVREVKREAQDYQY